MRCLYTNGKKPLSYIRNKNRRSILWLSQKLWTKLICWCISLVANSHLSEHCFISCGKPKNMNLLEKLIWLKMLSKIISNGEYICDEPKRLLKNFFFCCCCYFIKHNSCVLWRISWKSIGRTWELAFNFPFSTMRFISLA